MWNVLKRPASEDMDTLLITRKIMQHTQSRICAASLYALRGVSRGVLRVLEHPPQPQAPGMIIA